MKKLLLSILAIFTIQLVGSAQINWMTWDEAIEANKKNPKKIMVDVYTDWCGYCVKMDRNTFSDPNVIEAVNRDYYAVKFNAEQKEDIKFKNKKYSFVNGGRRGSHELAQMLLNGRMGYPTVVFLNDNAEVIQPVPGYIEPEKFTPIINYFAQDKYREMPFEKYLQLN